MRMLTKAGKRRYLQELIGPRTMDKGVLHFRALLMTALNEAEVWPPR